MVQWLSTMMNKSMTCYQIDKILYVKKKTKYSVRSSTSTEGMHTSNVHTRLVQETLEQGLTH